MKIMRFLLTISILLVLANVSPSYAIGDSASPCWGITKSVTNALENGSGQELKKAISENQKKHRSIFYMFKKSSKLKVYGGCNEEISGAQLLHTAAMAGNLETTKYLLKHGAKPEIWMFNQCSRNSTKSQDADAKEKRAAAISLILSQSEFFDDERIFECTDIDLVKIYFQLGAEADISSFEKVLKKALSTSGGIPNLGNIELLRVFLINGKFIESAKARDLILKSCGAPEVIHISSCRIIEDAERLNFRSHLLQSDSALTKVLRVCSSPYRRARLNEGNENCSILDNYEELRFSEFKNGIKYSEIGDLENYRKTFMSLDKSLQFEFRFDAYKSAVLFHLARAAGLSCKPNSESLLKAAVSFEERIRERSSQELSKRYFELGYFYFDQGKFSLAIPSFLKLMRGSDRNWLGGKSVSYLHKDLAYAYEKVGNYAAAELSTKNYEYVYNNNKNEHFVFNRVKYPEFCP